MPAKKLHPIHPGEVLREEFIEPMGMSRRGFAGKLGVPHTCLNQIVREKRSVTADTALRLSQALETTAEFGSTCRHAMPLTARGMNQGKRLNGRCNR
jgi:addiction module HigA family antidote